MQSVNRKLWGERGGTWECSGFFTQFCMNLTQLLKKLSIKKKNETLVYSITWMNPKNTIFSTKKKKKPDTKNSMCFVTYGMKYII